MLAHAEEFGANAVIGVRNDATVLMLGVSAVLRLECPIRHS